MNRILLWYLGTAIAIALLTPLVKILKQKISPQYISIVLGSGAVLFAIVVCVGGIPLGIRYLNNRNIPNITVDGHIFKIGKTTVADLVDVGCEIYLMTKEGDDLYLSKRDYYDVDFLQRSPINLSSYYVTPNAQPTVMHETYYVLVKDNRYYGSFNIYDKHNNKNTLLVDCTISQYYFSSKADRKEWPDITWNNHELKTLTYAIVEGYHHRSRNTNYGMRITPLHYASRFYQGALNLPYQRAYDVYIEFSDTDSTYLNEFNVAMYSE